MAEYDFNLDFMDRKYGNGVASNADTTDTGFDFSGLFKDKNSMGNMAGLAGTLMQAVALPTMLKNAKLQNKSLKFNLDTAKQEQARRNKNISSFNSVGSTPTAQTSAFV